MQNDFMQLPEALELCDFASLGDELGSNDSGDDDGHLEKKARVAAAGVVGEESLSAAEKAERSRERNREHARNTRMRKKAYVENLEQTVQELSAAREALEGAQARAASSRAAKREQWLRTLERVLSYRAAGEADEAKWAELLDAKCVVTLPITPYRSYSPAEVQSGRRVVYGVAGVAADVKSLAVCLDGLVRAEDASGGKLAPPAPLAARAHVEPREVHESDDGIMCPWTMRTVNAVALGARAEVCKHGMARAVFSREGKVAQLELAFDGLAFWQQLQRALGRPQEYAVVPNTLQMAMQPSQEARVITSASAPHAITHVNDAWVNLCGFSRDESAGQSLAILQGPQTDRTTVRALMDDVAKSRAASMRVTNYAKGTEPFANHLRVYPLAAPDGVISHFLGVLKDIGADGADGSGGARAPCDAAAQADKQPAAAAAAAVEGGAAETCA